MPNHLLTQFNLHQRLFNNVLNGFTDAETNRRPFGDKNVNRVKYLAGHLLNSQYGLAMIAGLKPEVKWNSLYEITRKTLSRLSSEDLAEPAPPPFEQVANSTGEMWAFLNHYIAYHIGQIGILRKAFGKEAMSYN